MGYCFVPDCNHHDGQQRCKMMRFPKSPTRRQFWIKSIRRNDAKPSSASKVCSCHFVDGLRYNGPTMFKRDPQYAHLFESSARKSRPRKRKVIPEDEVLDQNKEIVDYQMLPPGSLILYSEGLALPHTEDKQRGITSTTLSAVFTCKGNCKNLPISFKLPNESPQLDTCFCKMNASESSSLNPPSSEISCKVTDDSSPTSLANSLSLVSCIKVESSDNATAEAAPTSSNITSSVSTMEEVPSVSHTISRPTSKSPVVSSSLVSSMVRKFSDHPTKSKVSTSSNIISSSSTKTVKVKLGKPTSVVSSSGVSSIKVDKSDISVRPRVKTSPNIIKLKPSSLGKTTIQTSVPSLTPVSGTTVEHSKSSQQLSGALDHTQSNIIKLAPPASQQVVLETTDTPSPIAKGSTLPPLTPSGWFVVGPDGKAQLILSQSSAPKGAKVMSTPILLAPRGVVMSPPSTPVPQGEEQSLSNSPQVEIEVEATPKSEPMKNQVVILSPAAATKSKLLNLPRQQTVITKLGSQPSICKVVTVSSNEVQNYQSVGVLSTTAPTNQQVSTSSLQPSKIQKTNLTCVSSPKTIPMASPITKLPNSKIASTSMKVPNVQELATENSEVASMLGGKRQISNSASQSSKNDEAITAPALQAEKRQDAVMPSPPPQKVTTVTKLNGNMQIIKEIATSNTPGPKCKMVLKSISQEQKSQEESASNPPLLKGQVVVLPNSKGLKTYGKASPINTANTLVISKSYSLPPKLISIESTKPLTDEDMSSKSQTQKDTNVLVTNVVETSLIKGTETFLAKPAVVPSAKGTEAPSGQCAVAPVQPTQLPRPRTQVPAISGVGYPKSHLVATKSSEMSRNQLYILSDNKWVPLPRISAPKSPVMPVCDITQAEEQLSPPVKKRKFIQSVSKEVQTEKDGNEELITQLQKEMNELLGKYATAQNKISQLDTRLCTTLRSEKELHDRLEQEGHRLSFSHLSTLDGRITFYTGLKTDTFRWLLDLFTEPITCRPGFTVSKISKEDQLFITLVTLKLNRDNLELGDWFGVSKRTIYKVVWTWIDALHDVFFQLMKNIRSTQSSEDTLPLCFTPPPDCNMIFGCGDVVLQRTRLKPTVTTMKSLIGLAPNGLITFVADLYPQSMPDKVIVKECKLADFLKAQDLVLVDDIKELVPCAVNTSSPEFQVDNKKAVFKAEMSIEKCIHRIREYTILNSLPLCMASSSSKIWQVCAALTNLRTKLSLKEESEASPETHKFEEHFFDCVVIDVVDVKSD